jgi:HSP20 family molecular chaperone IbpA
MDQGPADLTPSLQHPVAPLRISRQVTPEAYLLRIAPGDGKTTDIQVTPSGRAVTISRASDAQTTEERSFDDGRGYMKSFSFASGAVSRRIPLPPDADMSAMTREESDGVVLIRIPRQSSDGGGQPRP